MEWKTVKTLVRLLLLIWVSTVKILIGIYLWNVEYARITVEILKFGTPQTIAIIVLKIEKFDVTLH